MLTDIVTVLWKEWKEAFSQRAAGRSGLLSAFLLLILVGVFLPLQVGEDWFSDPLGLLVWSWLPIFLTLGLATDSIAGERERHTLETLLATRLPDAAILLGKIAVAVLYSWGISVLGLLVAAITLNVRIGSGVRFYAPGIFSSALGFSLLSALLFAGLGVLASLRAPTARQAFQRLSLMLLPFYFLPMILSLLPEDWRMQVIGLLMRLNWSQVMGWLVTILIVLNTVVLGLCFQRFQRSRLLLD